MINIGDRVRKKNGKLFSDGAEYALVTRISSKKIYFSSGTWDYVECAGKYECVERVKREEKALNKLKNWI